MQITAEEAYVLLSIRLEQNIPDTISEKVLTSLVNRGYIYSSDPRTKPYQLTTSGKHRIGNHMLKERKLPEYIDKFSFPVAFDKFFTTASHNAINALCMSLVNSNGVKGLNPITLNRLKEQLNKELARQKEARKLSNSLMNKTNNDT